VLGGIILLRLRRLHICLTYVASFAVLAAVRSSITAVPFLASLAPVTGPMYQLFVFFMITDPRTTVQRRWAQCAVVVVVALVEAILRLRNVVYAPLYALFLVGPTALAFELWWDGSKPERASSA
jgi:Na+-translocating ferredoxin:NAD+ oxidoreductase RnfD subunit